nr:recombinase family protein [Neobacillus sp. Marseille-Q6967]
MKEILRVWAAYRVSTDRQGADGDNIPMQKAQCHAFAEQKGWQITKELTEKLSGYKTAIEDRDTLRIIKQGAINGDFDILLVYHSDRLGRQMEYSLWTASLYYLGVKVWSVKEGELKNQEHSDALQNFIRYWQSEGESKKTSIRVKDSMRQLNEEGYYLGGSIPYGYQLVDTGEKRNSKKDKTIKKIVVNPKKAKVVKMMFDMIINNLMGGSTIAQELNNLGLTNRGKIWRHNTVTRMLRNPVYIGYKKYNVTQFAGARGKHRKEVKRKDWLLQPFNPDLVIVSEEQFKKTKELMDKRAKQNRASSETRVPLNSYVLLSGLAVCGYCGHKLKSDFTNKKRVNKDGTVVEYRTYRYSCHHARNNAVGHGQRKFGAVTIDKQIEDEVIKAVSSIKFDAINVEKDAFDFEQLDARKIQLKELMEKYEEVSIALLNVEKLFDDIMLGKSKMSIEFVSNKMEEYGAKKIDLLEKIDKLKIEIEEDEVTKYDLDKLKYLLENWLDTYKNCIDLHEKKVMLSRVVREVVISKDSIVIKFNITIEKALEGSVYSNMQGKTIYTTGTRLSGPGYTINCLNRRKPSQAK